jgi:hypothetical protein
MNMSQFLPQGLFEDYPEEEQSYAGHCRGAENYSSFLNQLDRRFSENNLNNSFLSNHTLANQFNNRNFIQGNMEGNDYVNEFDNITRSNVRPKTKSYNKPLVEFSNRQKTLSHNNLSENLNFQIRQGNLPYAMNENQTLKYNPNQKFLQRQQSNSQTYQNMSTQNFSNSNLSQQLPYFTDGNLINKNL